MEDVRKELLKREIGEKIVKAQESSERVSKTKGHTACDHHEPLVNSHVANTDLSIMAIRIAEMTMNGLDAVKKDTTTLLTRIPAPRSRRRQKATLAVAGTGGLAGLLMLLKYMDEIITWLK